MPPLLPAAAASEDLGVPGALCSCWSDPDGQKDVVAVLAHLLLFAPDSAFPRLSACALSMAAAALQQGEEGIYLAAAVVVSTSQRLQKLGREEEPQLKLEDLECVVQLERH